MEDSTGVRPCQDAGSCRPRRGDRQGLGSVREAALECQGSRLEPRDFWGLPALTAPTSFSLPAWPPPPCSPGLQNALAGPRAPAAPPAAAQVLGGLSFPEHDTGLWPPTRRGSGPAQSTGWSLRKRELGAEDGPCLPACRRRWLWEQNPPQTQFQARREGEGEEEGGGGAEPQLG